MHARSLGATTALLTAALMLTGCGGGGGDGDGDANERPALISGNAEDTREVIQTALFRIAPTSVQTVQCTLASGRVDDCLALTFDANPGIYLPGGAFQVCPPNADPATADGGFVLLGDGNDAGGFRALTPADLTAFEASNIDILDGAGNTRIEDPAAPDNPGQTLLSACVQGTPATGVSYTIRIPVSPALINGAQAIALGEHIGVNLDGVQLVGPVQSSTFSETLGALPPSIVQPTPVDTCGGRVDENGVYQLHFAPEAFTVYDAAMTAPPCPALAADQTTLVGYARDGFPIYGPLESNGLAPVDLDACRGHVGTTNEFPDNIYHYHTNTIGLASVADGVGSVPDFLNDENGNFATGNPLCFQGDPVVPAEAFQLNN